MKYLKLIVFILVYFDFNCALGQKLASDSTLEVITWNLEWFGNPDKGPKDEFTQMKTAAEILFKLGNVDVIVFEEICDSKLFKRLADTVGFNFYLSPGSDNNQKIGLFYSKQIEVIDTPLQILQESKKTFAQRIPLQITVRHKRVGEVTIIGMHLKANIPSASEEDREDSYQRRQESVRLIKDYVTKNYSNSKVVLLGDWNDDVDVSNHLSKETPFKTLLNDPNFRFITYYLTFSFNQSSKYGGIIDHICISNELYSNFRSSAIIDVQNEFKKYVEICSDHFPVYSIFE